jgi:hypothetical protein
LLNTSLSAVGGAWESGERAADSAMKKLGFLSEPRPPAREPARAPSRRRR